MLNLILFAMNKFYNFTAIFLYLICLDLSFRSQNQIPKSEARALSANTSTHRQLRFDSFVDRFASEHYFFSNNTLLIWNGSNKIVTLLIYQKPLSVRIFCFLSLDIEVSGRNFSTCTVLRLIWTSFCNICADECKLIKLAEFLLCSIEYTQFGLHRIFNVFNGLFID